PRPTKFGCVLESRIISRTPRSNRICGPIPPAIPRFGSAQRRPPPWTPSGTGATGTPSKRGGGMMTRKRARWSDWSRAGLCALIVVAPSLSCGAGGARGIDEARALVEGADEKMALATQAPGNQAEASEHAAAARADLRAARDLYFQAGADRSRDPELLSEFAALAVRTEDYDLAAKAYRRAAEFSPETKGYWLEAGRNFVRVSFGGVRDEAEIRGHRRTYIGSMPGRLIQGIKQCGTKNPVFLLDEIDKMTADMRGDPTSALLEALDPEQNVSFSDHYIEATFDLSSVMFIATANLLENIPPTLRDRMEVIHFPSYTEQEKVQIAQKYLVPKKLEEHGLKKSQLSIPKATIEMMVREYTREAGVRWLQREIATVCRKTARIIAEGKQEKVKVDRELAHKMLGKPRFRYGMKGKSDEVGAATGLVYSEYGGDIITIEANLSEPFGEQPEVRLTGSLGDVMKESALAAMTYVRANQNRINPERKFRYDLHIHVPEGAVPKDGPSAGVTMLTALVSAYTGKAVRRDVAMTGEMTLRGKVLPVGGIREKVLAAHRAGIKHVILPEENMRDLDELPEGPRSDLEFHPVKTAEDVLKLALR
ncbi:MAG: AAA family ATPase, partial [Armatimonadetes bacterium]|nr:AAA family ATPase [Armatimonadota bacterium]